MSGITGINSQAASRRHLLSLGFLAAIGGIALLAGFAWGQFAHGAETGAATQVAGQKKKRDPKVLYPEKTELDFEGLQIEGELRNPGEFYFQHRSEEKFDSLVKRRRNFHREMLRDVVLSK